jgi:Fe-S-cluster containining protein
MISDHTVALDHPRFHEVWAAIFTRRVVVDCMNHRCAMVDENVPRLDACCQYGCDVDLHERDAILARADELRRVLRPAAADARWFDESEPEADADAPSGTFVRTETMNDGCIFLAHDRRGCAIHRVALENGWDFRGTKPHVCRLFPLTYGDGTISISDDYVDYSCAYEPDAPTLYRGARELLGELFGDALVAALDAAEAQVLAAVPRKLPVV